MRHYRKTDPDRHLVSRQGIYYYWRRIPRAVAALDSRPSLIRCSLKTDDLAEARLKRDALEGADNDYWSSLLLGESDQSALHRYRAAVRRAEAIGFQYRTSIEISQLPIEEIVQRVLAITPKSTPAPVEEAVLGREGRPKVTWWDAFDVYKNEIIKEELAKKSPGQLRRWENNKKRAISHFISLVGNKPIDDTTREDARVLYKHWINKVVHENGERKYSPSTANKSIGTLRKIYSEYYIYMKDEGRKNPFSKLNFTDSDEDKRKRLPFSNEWIEGKILAQGKLSGLNEDARGITLAMVETGCRPAELCNIVPDDIFLDEEVPYIHIKSRTDPDDVRQIKTANSNRKIPLVGVSLAVFRKFPGGFPRYKDKESVLSATVNKYMTENGLRPGPKYSLYSLRHSFEDRMLEGGIDPEVREVLVGHALDRPFYGEKGKIEFRQKILSAIAFDFDPSIV